MNVPPRIAFSTLAFPDATLAAAAAAGRRWGYSGIELRLIDGELIRSWPNCWPWCPRTW